VSHSTYLSLLCEMGLPGLIGYLAILLYFVWIILRRMLSVSSSDPSYHSLAALLAALMSLMAHGGVANVEDSRGLWVLLAIILAYDHKVLAREPADPGDKLPPATS